MAFLHTLKAISACSDSPEASGCCLDLVLGVRGYRRGRKGLGRGCGRVRDSERGRQCHSGQDTVQLLPVLGHPAVTRGLTSAHRNSSANPRAGVCKARELGSLLEWAPIALFNFSVNSLRTTTWGYREEKDMGLSRHGVTNSPFPRTRVLPKS